MILDPSLQLAPLSDTIQSIHLNGIQSQTDTGIIDMLWTNYWGWDAAIYELLESIDLGPWELVDVSPDPVSTYAYNKSFLAHSYRMMIRSIESISELVTESNWIEFVIPVKIVPNIITPNGDGVNDFFFVSEQLLYEPIHLIVFNRWGGKVFEDTDYENKWDGDNFGGKPLSDGTYYYLLKFTGADDRAGFITILR
jgi:gliding motility-associated-like protein